MPNYFSKIDATTIADHARLLPTDTIFYLFEYVSGQNYTFGATNNLISNLKKSPLFAGTNQYWYKENAIAQCRQFLKDAINPVWLKGATLVPVPPSKAVGHAEYDDRMSQICEGIPVDFALDVRNLVIQTESTEPFHVSGVRPSVEELLEIYAIAEEKVAPAPQRIAIVDDVLTAGTHYRAMHSVLRHKFPDIPIAGMFVARRIFAEAEED